MTARPVLRPYRPDDVPALNDVAVRTGHEGGDARSLFTDPDMLAAVFVGPYVHLEPDLAFVVDNSQRPVGYIVGTADTPTFATRVRDDWLPVVTDRYPHPPAVPETAEEQLAFLLHYPEYSVRPELAEYPAHLHINLLPQYQGAGYGRALMSAFLTAVRDKGAEGAHLGVARNNIGAIAFYQRLGFHELSVSDSDTVRYFGRASGEL